MAFSAGIGARTDARQGSTPPPLATIVYRSRAVAPLPGPALRHLVQTAQARNQGEAITGVMLYDDTHFFQWLEGPPDGVDRVMHSIHNDRRHTDVEILSRRRSPARRFSGWDMKFAAPGARTFAWPDEVIEPPAEVIENLRRQPKAAPGLLVRLSPVPLDPTQAGGQEAAALVRTALGQASAAVLKSVIRDSVIPMLLQRHGRDSTETMPPAVNPRAAELAELLIASDQTAALDLIRELRGGDADPRHLYAPLFEPAARSLGDLWNNDICSEFEVTLGLCRLQTAVRLLGVDVPRGIPLGDLPNVLVAPVPGELHQLMAGLDSEWLTGAGWAPQIAFPTSDRALQDLLSASWIDVLDLSLSAAFRREDSLPRLAKTIAKARRASRNPALLVVVGGRAFVEDGTAGPGVGADLASRSSENVDQRIIQGMRVEAALRDADGAGTSPRRRIPPVRGMASAPGKHLAEA
ncbi:MULTISPECIES: BLUF domain-containing protein [Roseomonadaceae]|uniref:BLUF domain-containing protein n=1 Tax=Falsiroseomonas oleicola TaxID=2801474 RepID=A0ABS6H4P7_9PROT|nr:BLUF domain-containing protein [Roseomonas oleicola]MBU8543366.1 BLUF domain-containing protein [Roseomonas oleicola]